MLQICYGRVFEHRLTTRSRHHVVDDVSVQRVINNDQQQQQSTVKTTTATNLTDCIKSFTQQERVSSVIDCDISTTLIATHLSLLR